MILRQHLVRMCSYKADELAYLADGSGDVEAGNLGARYIYRVLPRVEQVQSRILFVSKIPALLSVRIFHFADVRLSLPLKDESQRSRFWGKEPMTRE